tara:strand:+ start:2161 stop:6816 length:4656 start_codon:yes stop_codon:yes gene_type:complete
MPSSFDVTANVNLDPRSLNASAKKIELALGRITGQASEFQKSLDASTARVFAFGATTAVLNGVNQAFKKLVSTTIEVEKRLIEINSIFQANEKVFNQFRNSIFQVAKDTGQAFGTVAEGAAELARQGLSAEETAKRLKASLVLTRISGLDAEKSVKALTAAINGFASAGLSANQIVNKLVAVDTAFAVSAQDLAEAFSRAGSTAEDAGVSFDQLLGLVTAVEQKTARGGAVIGNAFKSIFTRLSRGDTIEDLKELGVQIDATQNGIQKLSALSAALESISDPTIASQIKELAGGVFQINVVSAALKDLSSDTSIFAGAAKTASEATNEAFQKNADLNRSLAAQINALIAGLTSLAERVGSLTFGPLLENLLGLTTKFTEFLDKALDPEKGNAFVKGLFKTIGQFLGGPAVVIFTGAFVKIFALVAKFAKDGLMSVFAIGSETSKIRNIEAGIVGLLQKDNQLRQLITSSTASQAQKEQAIISAIKAENALLTQQASLMNSIASAARARGVASFNASTGQFKGKKGFASGFMQEEATAMALGATGGVKAHFGQGTIGGRRFIMNNQEMEIPNFAGGRDSAVIPMYAKANPPKKRTNKHSSKTTGSAAGSAAKGKRQTLFMDGSKFGMLAAFSGKSIPKQSETSLDKLTPLSVAGLTERGHSVQGLKRQGFSHIGVRGLKVTTLDAGRPNFQKKFQPRIQKAFAQPLVNFGSQIIGDIFKGNDTKSIGQGLKKSSKDVKLFSDAAEGGIIESAIKAVIAGSRAASVFSTPNNERAPFDFEENTNLKQKDSVADTFFRGQGVKRADAKRTADKDSARSFIPKILQDKSARSMALPRGRGKAAGHIPRFAKGKAPKGDDGMGGGGMFLALSSASMALNTMSASGDEAGGALSGLAETASKAVNALLTFQTLSFITGGKLGGAARAVGGGLRAGTKLGPSIGMPKGLKNSKFMNSNFMGGVRGFSGTGGLSRGAGRIVGRVGGALGGLGKGAVGLAKGVGAVGAGAAATVVGSIAGLTVAANDLFKSFKGLHDETLIYGKLLGGTNGKFQQFFDNIAGVGNSATKKFNISNTVGMNAERANLKRQLSGIGGKGGIDLFDETFAGQEDEVNAAFKKFEEALKASAEKTEQGIPTEEARKQATLAFTQEMKKLGGITKDTIFQQTDFNRRQKFLNDEIGRLRSRIKNAANTPQMRDIQNSAMISSNMKDRADIMGALQFSGDFSSSVGAAVNATQRKSAASDALMQKRALQAQLVTETDPKKRKDLEKGIEDAGKNFADIVKDSSINFANNIVDLEKQMVDATSRRVDIINSTLQRDTSKRKAFLSGGAQDKATVLKLFAEAQKARKKVDDAEAFARKGRGSRAFIRGFTDPVEFRRSFEMDRQNVTDTFVNKIRPETVALAGFQSVEAFLNRVTGGAFEKMSSTVQSKNAFGYEGIESKEDRGLREGLDSVNNQLESLSEAINTNKKALDDFAESFSTDEAKGIPESVKQMAGDLKLAADGAKNIKNITEPFEKVSAMTITAAETAQEVVGRTEKALKGMITRVEGLEKALAELKGE